MIPEGAILLFDTNILVHVIRRDRIGRRLLEDHELLTRGDTPLISYVTLGELYVLANSFGWGEQKREFVETIRMNLVVVPIEDNSILENYVELDTLGQSTGRQLGKNDLWIAATALAADAHLLTTDKDFAPLSDRHVDVVLVDPDTGKRVT